MCFWVGTLLDGYKAIDNGVRYLNVFNLGWIYEIKDQIEPNSANL